MKKPLVILLALGAAGSALAVDMGRVISSTPVLQQVAVPRQVCTSQDVAVQQPKSGAGAVLGAIAGGALGNAAGGRGSGRAAATVIGAVGGAVLGDRIEGSPEPELRTVQRCSTQTIYENRAVAYNVVYEFAGKQYSTQLPHDPGPTLALQIGPVGATTNEQQQSYAADIPVYSEPQPSVVIQQVVPAYPVYYPRPYYYPPVTLDLGFGYWGGYRGGNRDHRHWR
jgi:uncharacterized protein YcfJ